MRLSELQSIVCRLARRVFGLSALRERDTLYVIPLVPFGPTVPQSVRIGFILSCSPLPYGVSLAAPSDRLFRVGTTLPGFLPSTRRHRAESPSRFHGCESFQPLATFRPRVFSTPRRFPPPLGFAGLLHPAATSRVLSPFRGFSRFAAVPVSSTGRAPLPLSPRRSPAKPAATTGPLDFEALFRNSVRSSGMTV